MEKIARIRINEIEKFRLNFSNRFTFDVVPLTFARSKRKPDHSFGSGVVVMITGVWLQSLKRGKSREY